ncbi:uncharacterized protein LOC135378706 [Ornithodoros turicata]|uniref:uncharacterized protein LOC135378706 n=1 Tax=Ornithodoros turicata TaxID=34597 RepID=UPI00313978B7
MSTGDAPPTGQALATTSVTPVSSIAVKLPPYWDRNPATWFIQAEAQFHLSGISAERTKYYHVIAALSPSAAEELFDIIANPPADTPYQALKAALLKRTSPSDRARLQQLLSAEELGDRRPTQLLRRMKQLLGEGSNASTDSFLRELFLQRLPKNVQMVLASTHNLGIEELASLADAVMEVASPATMTLDSVQAPQVDAPPSVPPFPDANSNFATLSQQVAHLTQLVAALSTRSRSPSPRRQRFRSRNRSPRHRSPGSRDRNGLCWYHHRFGQEARHCFQPCAWSGNPPANH